MAYRRKLSKKSALLNLQAAVKSAFEDASDHADTHLSPLRTQAMKFYTAEPFGDEVDGRSQFVMSELRDCAQVCLTNLMRVFASKTSKIFEFQPRTPKDVAQAAAQTDMVAYIIDCENDGYTLVQTLIRDALTIPGGGVAHWHYEPQDTIAYETYTGLDQAQAAFLRNDPEVAILDERIEVKFDHDDHGLEDHHLDHLDDIAQTGGELPPPGAMLPAAPQPPDAAAISQAAAGSDDPATAIMGIMPEGAEITIALKIRRTTPGGRIVVQALPPECFIIDRRAKCLDTAAYVARREIRTVSDLVDLGYDIEEILEYAGADDTSVTHSGMEEYVRNGATFFQSDTDAMDDASRRVLFCEHFIRHDFDQDGIAELLRIVTVGGACHMLADPEPVSEIPFAQFIIDPTPHSAIHLNSSLFSQVSDIQLAKSQIMRDIFDGLAQSISPKVSVVEGQVNMDDVLNDGTVLRMKQPGMIQAMQSTFDGGNAMNVLAYLDDTKSQRTGISRNSMGLDADALQSTSATAVSAMTEAASARMELMARTLAEIGFKRLARGVGRLVRRHQNRSQMIKLREQWVEIDPRSWTSDLDCIVTAGIGRGDEAQKFGLLTQILGLQEKLMTTLGVSNPICGITNYRNTLSDLANAGGIVDSSRYFREITPEMEQQMAASQQKKPLGETEAFMAAEQMKTQSRMEIEKYKMILDAAKAMSADDLARDRLDTETALKSAEIAGRYGAQVDTAKLKAQVDADRHSMDAAVTFAQHLVAPAPAPAEPAAPPAEPAALPSPAMPPQGMPQPPL